MCLAAAKNRTMILGCPSHGLVTVAAAYNIPARVAEGGGGWAGLKMVLLVCDSRV